MPVVSNIFIWDPWFYALAVPVVLLVGISKGGFGGGVGLVAVPLLSIVMPLPQAAAILLPILCVMDLFAVSAIGESTARRIFGDYCQVASWESRALRWCSVLSNRNG